MLKRLGTFALTLILMVSTVGVNVSVMWCGDEWTGVEINGIHFLTEAGEAMKGCCTDVDGGCSTCHHESQHFQIQSQYMGGQGVSIAPAPMTTNWLAYFFTTSLTLSPTVEEGSDSSAGFYYPPPCHDDASYARRGLRAPPVWA